MAAQEIANGGAQPERHSIGISFGNSTSSIAAVTVEDKAEVIANEDGDRQIPTILSYVDEEEYAGTQAKAQLIRNKDNTVAYFRDFLGQDFKSIDPTHAHASAHPKEHEGGVAFTVKEKSEGEPSTITVSDVTTRLIKRLVNSASDYTGKQVDSAVITVPTNFNDKQREALTQAAQNAGIEVLQLVNEPIAALLAYDGRVETKAADKVVVVADFGGTRSDVTVVASRGGVYTILATVHDYAFAGCHLDEALMDHFAKEFIKWNTTDPRKEARSLAKLKHESEMTKKALSIGTNAAFSVESLAEGIDFASTINRLRYEMIGRKVFDGLTRLVHNAVSKAGFDVLDIDQVILSGGTSHTPRIAANLRGLFPERTEILAPSTTPTAINPSELAARGAALQASLIQEYDSADIQQSTHPAVTIAKHTSHSVGVLAISEDDARGVFVPVVAAETALPARRSIHINAPKAGGDVLVRVVEAGADIKVTKPEPKPKAEKEEEDEDESDEEEEEEVRERVWKVGKGLAELAVKGVKVGGQVEVTLMVAADLSVVATAREVGDKSGVRGTIPAPQ